jgi:Ala-tRNA(Pro) deacylase
MPIARSVESFLKEHHVDYELVHHPRTVTSMRTAEVAHVPGTQLAKSVLLEDETGYLMAVIPSTHRIDLGKLHHQLGRRIGLALERDVTELFPDCDPGAIPAVGAAYRVETIIDDTLLVQPDVYFEAGDHEELVHMSGAEFGAMMAGVQHGQFTHRIGQAAGR